MVESARPQQAPSQVVRGSSTPALVRAVRPRQWVKNLLVGAAPLAAAEIGDPEVLGATAMAFVAFCASASAVYLVNDVLDQESDRNHPLKRSRPVASGALSVRTAVTAAAVLAMIALGVAASVNLPLLGLMAIYLTLNAGYVLGLKHEPVIDLVLVACGFLLRAVAGGVAAELPLSDWFLLVAGFGSLYIVAGKRYSELHQLGAAAGTRSSLVRYSESYLRFVWGIAATATLMSYCLWAFEESAARDQLWLALSIVPFLVGLLRYAVDIDHGRAGEPEDIIWSDRALQVVGLFWLTFVSLGVFLG